MKNRDFWINQAFFQVSWPACVIGAAQGLLWPGAVVVGVFAWWQLRAGRSHPADPRTLLMFASAGILLETFWLRTGLLEYALQWPLGGFAPLWLVLLWISLGLAANHSMAVFKRRPLLLASLAAIGSPVSYTAAAGLGAVPWTAPGWLVVLCIGPVWGLLVAGLFRMADPAPAYRIGAGAGVGGSAG